MGKISNQFLANYLLMFIISVIIAALGLALMDFANHVISKTLAKNNFTAESIMQDNYNALNTELIIQNGGGVQVINSNYEIVFTKGIDTLKKDKLTIQEFTEFLIKSNSKGIEYSYSIQYNTKMNFWLIVTFPTSFRIDFMVVHNKEFSSADKQRVLGIVVAILIFYLILLALSTIIYSKISSIRIVTPLKRLSESVSRFRDGDYSVRVDLKLQNEFKELQDTFNAMAQELENQILITKKLEETRKKLMLDISHDLRNPLTCIIGYAELYQAKMKEDSLSIQEQETIIRIILENSSRANVLISGLFEMSKMESPEFLLDKKMTDICEYLREKIVDAMPLLDRAGFAYDFNIPENEIYVLVDTIQLDRVFQNLLLNTIQYNTEGTRVTIVLLERDNIIEIIFKDDGVGMSPSTAENIFKPFVRADVARNSQTGGTGLGLAIVEKIIALHGGSVKLKTDEKRGCEFIILLPK